MKRIMTEALRNGQGPIYFGSPERMYGYVDLFADTFLFEYVYQNKRLYLSPNAEGQMDPFALEQILKDHKKHPPKKGEIRNFEFCMGKTENLYRWYNCELTAQWKGGGTRPVKIIGKVQDITESKAKGERLLLCLSGDRASGILNKTIFEHRVNAFLKRNRHGWLCAIDMRNLKDRNNRTADGMTGLLRSTYPEPDLIAHKNSRFLVFTAAEDAKVRAEAFLYKAENMLSKEGKTLSAHIGIVSVSGEKRENCQRLLKRADRALVHLGKSGKSRIAVFKDDKWEID